MSGKTRLLIALLFVGSSILTVHCSNAGVDDSPDIDRPRSRFIPDEEEVYCYEQMSGDGYFDVVCE